MKKNIIKLILWPIAGGLLAYIFYGKEMLTIRFFIMFFILGCLEIVFDHFFRKR